MTGTSAATTSLQAFLQKLEIDDALSKILIDERITSIRKFSNMTPAFLDSVKEKANYTAAEVDINSIKRFLPAHAYLLQSTKKFPNYEEMSLEEIDGMIATYEEKENESTVSLPTIINEAPTTVSTRSVTKRDLNTLNDCLFTTQC